MPVESLMEVGQHGGHVTPPECEHGVADNQP